MKIALIHYSFAPLIGGVETVLAAHARLFAEHGHEVTVLCENGDSNYACVRFERLPDQSGAAELADALAPRLADQSLVIVHNVLTMPFALPLTDALLTLSEKLPRVRFVAWVHDMAACNADYDLSALSEKHRSMLRKAGSHFEYVAVSELRRRQFQELTGDENCRVIPNGVDPAGVLGFSDTVAEFAQEFRLLEREFILLHPARILRRKNIELGLRVTAALKAAGRSVAYLVTGPPDPHNATSQIYAEELRALRSALDLENDALFLLERSSIDARDLAGLFALADALFFPSKQEGFGLPVIEAALQRLPIFCAAIEPLDSLLAHGVTTFPLDAEPAKVAAQIIARLESDAAWQARREVRERYTWTAVYRNFLAPLLAETETPRRS